MLKGTIATFAEVEASGRIDPSGVEVFDRGDEVGKSVRTTKSYRRDEIVCSYGGRLFPSSEPSDTLYAYLMNGKTVVDGDPRWPETQGHVGSFINDACGPVRNDAVSNNVCFSNGFVLTSRGKVRAVWIKAKRDLPEGTELFLSYGRGYWAGRDPNLSWAE